LWGDGLTAIPLLLLNPRKTQKKADIFYPPIYIKRV